ncbi:MAG: helix-turn-helix domain-containing protein [Phocaeicola dorei]|nr:helix-turn-helix domain-containing protein [Phocaeicola dorei]
MELITKEDCQATVDALMLVKAQIGKLREIYKPTFDGEHYLSGEEVCDALHISKRTLQEYRDNQMIPYISLPGKMLYKESDILALLEENYIPAMAEYKTHR